MAERKYTNVGITVEQRGKLEKLLEMDDTMGGSVDHIVRKCINRFLEDEYGVRMLAALRLQEELSSKGLRKR